MGHFLHSMYPYEEKLGCYNELEACIGSWKDIVQGRKGLIKSRDFKVCHVYNTIVNTRFPKQNHS